MATCAMVNRATGIIDNLIVADASIDPAPDGYELIPDPPDYIRIGMSYPYPTEAEVLAASHSKPPVVDGVDTL